MQFIVSLLIPTGILVGEPGILCCALLSRRPRAFLLWFFGGLGAPGIKKTASLLARIQVPDADGNLTCVLPLQTLGIQQLVVIFSSSQHVS